MAGSAFELLARGGAGADCFGAEALVQALLDVEAALAQSHAAAGKVSEAVALTIAGVCKVGLFDHDAVIAAGALRGNLAAEVADRLRETVALFDSAAAREVHRELEDRDALQLAQRLLVRRALAALDEHLSTIVHVLAKQPGAGAAAQGAGERALRLQDRVRTAGALALTWTSLEGGTAAALSARLCAQRLQLACPDRADMVTPPLQSDDTMALLLCGLARAGADLERIAAVLRTLAGPAVAGPSDARIAGARQLVGTAASRAPYRVAAWLACMGADDRLEAAAAEVAALIESTLAAAGLLADILVEMRPMAAAESAASSAPDSGRAAMTRAAPPWRQWLG